ncbi:hypothetical protein [Luteimonas sp. A478]
MLITLVRWVLALMLGFIAWGAFSAGDTIPSIPMFAGALVVLPPVGHLLGRLARPVKRPAVAIAIGFVLVLGGLALAGLTAGGGMAPDSPHAADTVTVPDGGAQAGY